jgi:hypothetical protein
VLREEGGELGCWVVWLDLHYFLRRACFLDSACDPAAYEQDSSDDDESKHCTEGSRGDYLDSWNPELGAPWCPR